VAAPLISRHFHSDRKELVQLIVGLSGLAAGSAALAGLVFFFLFGSEVLSLFEPAYRSYFPILLILCIGQFFAAATGPVGPLLILSGHERMDLILVTTVSGGAVILQIICGFYWGAIGVALASAGATVFANVFATIYARRKLRIDTTGLSLAVHGTRKLFLRFFHKTSPTP
jgi:O-antigen/teichoic acid export membrane protein